MRRTARIPPRNVPHMRVPDNSDVENDVFGEKTSTETKITAFVAHAPDCEHSEALVDLAIELGVELNIYDVYEIDPPDWLEGTPTIQDDDGNVYCGDAAFEFLMSRGSNDGGGSRRKPLGNDVGPAEKESSDDKGSTIQAAMRESERLARVAETFHEPQGSVDSLLSSMMDSRR